MGVPVVTCRGDRPVSRQSAAMLAAVGLGDLAADSADEFVAIAVRLCRNTQDLVDLRQGMRERLAQSPLFDPQRFAQAFIPALWDILKRPACGMGTRP